MKDHAVLTIVGKEAETWISIPISVISDS